MRSVGPKMHIASPVTHLLLFLLAGLLTQEAMFDCTVLKQ